jgi:hypothetical protein
MPKPILQSLILADHVYEDKLTGKRIIAGVFNRIIRGVRVLKDITPPAPAPPQPAQPIQVMPSQPIQPTEPIQIHHGQSLPPSPPVEPSQSAPPPSQPVQPGYAPPPSQMAQSAASHAPAPASEPVPASHSPPVAPPAYPPAPSQPGQLAPPPIPPAPPLQPGQRVLEIPPTGLQSGSPFAYLSLTEVRGVTPLMLQLVNLQDDTQLFRSDLRVECHNPLYTIELTVPLPPIAPPQAGIYALELLYNNELLGSLRIVVEDAIQ